MRAEGRLDKQASPVTLSPLLDHWFKKCRRPRRPRGRQCTIYYLQMALSSVFLVPHIPPVKAPKNGARPQKKNIRSVVAHVLAVLLMGIESVVDQELSRSCWRCYSRVSSWRLSFSSCRSRCSPVDHSRRSGGLGEESGWLSEVTSGGLGEGCCERRCSKALARAYGLGGSGCCCVACWRRYLGKRREEIR